MIAQADASSRHRVDQRLGFDERCVRGGGYKQSGRGRLRGLAGLEDFLEYKHIVINSNVIERAGNSWQ
jgi:hypothetical protein